MIKQGQMALFQLNDLAKQNTYRISFSNGYKIGTNPRFRETFLEAWDINDVDYWQGLVVEKYESLESDYYRINNIDNFKRMVNSHKENQFEFPSLPQLNQATLGVIIIALGVALFITTTLSNPETKPTVTKPHVTKIEK